MRPIKLVISAFGPYGNPVELEMEKLGSRGLYLITGDTGAGKTTIFDAICFALYGEASGSNRRSDMLRSNFADGKTPTFVELEFCCGGKTYVVRRSPEYERPKERGDGVTTQKAEASLIFPDGRQPLTRWKEVTAAITELIGLDREQFSQIAMIAQGDFLRLLLAKTEERSKIFREIFHTGPYQRFQERVRQEAAALRTTYENLQRSMEQYASGIQCDGERLAQITAEDGAMELLAELLEEDLALQQKLNEAAAEQELAIQNLDGQLAQAELACRTRRELEAAEKRLPQIQEDLRQKRKDLDDCEAYPEKTGALYLQAETLRQSLPQYDRLMELQSRQKKLEQWILDGENQRQQAEKETQRCQQAVGEIEAETQILLETSQRLAQLRAAVSQWNTRIEQLASLEESGRKLQLAQATLECGQREYLLAREEAERLAHSYGKMERLFLDQQAGILASGLEDGQPCPVCGSCHHPQPAQIMTQAPGQAQLEQERERLEQANGRRDRASAEAHRLDGQAAVVRERFMLLAADILGLQEEQLVMNALPAERQSAMAQVAQLQSEAGAAEQKCQQLQSRQEKLPSLRQRMEQTAEHSRKLELELAAWAAEQSALTEALRLQKEKLAFEDRSQAEKQVSSLIAQAKQLERQLQLVRESCIGAEQSLERQTAHIQLLRQQLAELPELDEEQLRRQRAQWAEQRQQCLRQREQVVHRLTANGAIQKQLEQSGQQLHKLGQTWTIVRSLSETVNGAISGKEKVMLETYVQMTFFDRVLRRANVRLLEMTGGRYTLQRRTASGFRSQSGLELDVVDHGTGMARSAASLSGGESFQASLSLALGMSDELQPVGGVRLESLFVDEGFGSLDEEALRQAMQTLQGLSQGDRLVGIISHVELLKQWVDRQIRVTRLPDGQSQVKICIDM